MKKLRWCISTTIVTWLIIPSIATATNHDSAFIALNCQIITAQRWHTKPFGALVALVAQLFVGKPYLAGTLDSSDHEYCHFTSNGFDCVTFVESTVALSRIAKLAECNYPAFLRELTLIRYRKGVLNGYLSRLHYTSDWIRDNVAKGVIENLSQQLGGRAIKKKLDFMSTHAALYPRLRDSIHLVSGIAAIERQLSKHSMMIVPLSRLSQATVGIQSGDIIAVATNKEGLDYAHLGIALRSQGKLQLIHASSKSTKITIEPSLEDYLRAYPGCIGISIVRPLDPTSKHSHP